MAQGIDLAGFQNTRVTCQRLRDAKLFHGWVESFERESLVIRTSLPPSDMRINDRIYVQIFGLEYTGTLQAEFHQELELSLLASDHLEGFTLIDLQTTTALKVSPADPQARLATNDVSAEIDGMPCQILDISRGGFSALLSMAPEKGETVPVRLLTVAGVIEVEAEVRNIRELEGFRFRVGFQLKEMGRLESHRWERLFQLG